MQALEFWKPQLLNGYVWATAPYRRGLAAWWQCCGKSPISILFYHRVADRHPNAWTISGDEFVRQMRWLQARFDCISLSEVQRRLQKGHNPRPAVSITFDDGYAENCERALPWLIAAGIPCTYFVAWDYVRDARPFPHDLTAGCPLPPNTLPQLRSLAAAGVEIGCHTRTHANLGAIQDVGRLREEVVTLRGEMEQELETPIRYFAFPYGLPENLNRQVFELARAAGYAGVCSAYGGYNFPGDDPFHLQRIHGDPEFARFRNWLSFDPRKLQTPRWDDYPPSGHVPAHDPPRADPQPVSWPDRR